MKSLSISTHDKSQGFTSGAVKAHVKSAAVAATSGSKTAWSLRTQGGFTLMEVIVAMGVFSILIGMGLYFSFDDYRGYLFRSEADLVVNVLQKARNQAMNNIGESAHGVRIEDGDYILFRGSSYATRDTDFDEIYPGNTTIDVTETDIIFEQLTGEAVDIDLTVTDGFRVRTVEITEEGRIDW